MSYNIRFGGRGREARIAEVVRTVAPDLVVFQEATDTRVVERLARETGLNVWAARRGHSLAYISRAEVAHHEWYHPRGSKHSGNGLPARLANAVREFAYVLTRIPNHATP